MVTKEPWRMTQEEYSQGSMGAAYMHNNIVVQAVMEGRPTDIAPDVVTSRRGRHIKLW